MKSNQLDVVDELTNKMREIKDKTLNREPLNQDEIEFVEVAKKIFHK